MAIPDYQTCMLPLLRYLGEGGERSLSTITSALADQFGLTDAERSQLLPSGQQTVLRNRVGWARTYLKKAGLIENTRRAVFQITPRGQAVLSGKPEQIDNKALAQWPEFREFLKPEAERPPLNAPDVSDAGSTPEESIEAAYQTLREQTGRELLAKVLGASPEFFEQLVVELLVKMGYGGSRRDAGERIGRSGDGGVVGIIKEDRLGLDTIFLQAKRWQGTVGRPEIQKFVGALQGQRARKGVFLTTSTFTADAIDYVLRIDTKVVLIDGHQLTDYMMDFDVGVAPFATFTVKRIDSDYFDDG